MTTGGIASGNRSRTAIFLQDACYQHRYIRSNDHSAIVERPERLRAVKLGLAAGIARLEESRALMETGDATDDLVATLEKLDILQDVNLKVDSDVVDIVKSAASVNLTDNAAVKFVHGDIDGDVYLENLIRWTKESIDKVRQGESEIPPNLPQGDLYLCPGSLDAIQGALGTVCEAVDVIVGASRSPGTEQEASSKPPTNAFVAIRPPGHHCGEDVPCGFCFVNNVAVASAHAHLKHGIKKVVILDIDLHHGNGTQAIVWQINEETYRKTLESESVDPSGGAEAEGLQVYYGSIHDILSFPCEDGKVDLVQAASTSLHGPHGQYIENIHLQTYSSDEDFWTRLYPGAYNGLLKRAETFLEETKSLPNEVLVFISCGFDACEHEYPSMSRHGRRVPASFYHRFTRDARAFAEKYANGKLISVLEGGYSDRALTSGAMAHLCGLAGAENVDEKWWDVDKLVAIEKSSKKRRAGGRVSVPGASEKWLDRTMAIFSTIDTTITPSSSRTNVPPPSSMTLRERKPVSAAASPKASPQVVRKVNTKAPQAKPTDDVDDMVKTLENLGLGESSRIATPHIPLQSDPNTEETVPEGTAEVPSVGKKLPRVILHVKGPEGV